MRQTFVILRHMEGKYIAGSLLVSLIRFADQRNIDLLERVDQMGIDLQDESKPVSFHFFSQMMEYVADKTGDRDLGVHLGEQYNMAALGIVGQLVQISATLEQAVKKSMEYFNTMSNAIEIDMKVTDTARITFRFCEDALIQYPVACRHLLMSSLVFSYREIFYLTLKKINPIGVGIKAELEDSRKLEQIMKCPITIGANSNYIEFEKHTLTTKIRFANYELFNILEKVVCDQLKKYTHFNQSLSKKIKGIIFSLLSPDIPSFKQIAENMNMSKRSLQRHLKNEGTNYTKLVREVRQELAIEYLKQDHTTKEISYLLGYSEPSSFVNAFRGWFNISPGQYRKNTRSKTR